QHQNLALFDGERAVVHAQHLTSRLLNLGPALALVHQGQGAFGVVAKNDVDRIKDHRTHLRVTRSILSSMTATATMTKPASKPSLGSLRPSACTMGLPSPSAPT